MTLLMAGVLGAVFVALAIAERRRPLRRRVESDLPHTARNLAVAGLGGVATGLAELAVGAPVARWVERRRPGLLPRLGRLGSVRVARAVVGFLLLDYTLYAWHRLNHHAPLLWRFHVVHHVDRDLDASTGLRFHAGELGLAAGFRAAQLVALGVDRPAFLAYQTVLLVSVLFHHSNWRLPLGLERRLVRMVVTPRMHGIHHSVVERESASNFSSLLAGWDRLHGTLRLNVPQAAVTIGVPAYPADRDASLARVLALPFDERRPAWRGPDGRRPDRPAWPGSPAALAP